MSRIAEIADRHPAVGLAVGVVENDNLTAFHAHGLADIASRTPITQDTVFRIASITKTFTAIAIMQLWEQQLIDLDAPAERYLRAYRLVPRATHTRLATVRQLLTHTAGIPEVLHPLDVFKPLFGEIVKAGCPVPTPAELYRAGLPVHAEPGTRFIYSDHNFATLGQMVADVSGEPFDRYLREHVFDPLGMAHTDIVRSARVKEHLATGYTLGAKGARAVDDYEAVTAGASCAYSTGRDMARYLGALLGAGANRYGSVLKPGTLAMMFEPHYRPDPRLPGMGLAFFRADLGGHHAVEHQGVLPGFHSQIFAAPDDGVAVMAFTNGATGAMMWLPGECAALLGQLIGAPAAALRAGIAHHPEIWRDLCGWYHVPARLSDARMRAMAGAGVEVFVRRGRLMLRILTPIPLAYKGFELHPDDDTDPYAFRMDLSSAGIGPARVVFSRGSSGEIDAVHFDLMPLSAHKQPDATNPRRWATGALAAAAGALALRLRRQR